MSILTRVYIDVEMTWKITQKIKKNIRPIICTLSPPSSISLNTRSHLLLHVAHAISALARHVMSDDVGIPPQVLSIVINSN